MINQNVAEVGLQGCFEAMSLPLLQDNSAGSMWSTLGAIYNTYLVFDAQGVLTAAFPGLTLPSVAEELEQAIQMALP